MTWRAVLLGLFGAVEIAILQIVTKIYPQTVVLHYQSVLTLFAGSLFLLFTLCVVNAFFKRWRPTWRFTPQELALIYGISTVAASIAGQDEAQFLWPMMAYPFRAGQDDSMGAFRHYIPTWLVPHDPKIIEPYYSGNGSFWEPERLRAWAIPLGCWLTWLFALGATMWAWNVILRRRWVEHDKLAFPCVQLPLELCRNGGFGGLVGGKLFWVGFGLSALLESLSVIHNRFPNVPAIVLDWQATELLEGLPSPWKALAPMYLTWSTVHLGISYLIPLDILFSGWFFFIARKLLEVFGYAQGWRELGWDAKGFPYTRAQSAGSWTVLFFLLIWAERKHLAQVMDAAFSWGKKSHTDDANEPGSYAVAGRTLVLGTLFLYWWSVQSGMSPLIAAAFYGFFWVLNVTMTRVYALVGPSFLELYYLDPQKMLTTLFGTLYQEPGSLVAFSQMYWINRDHRGQLMGHQLEAFKIAQAVGLPLRKMGIWVLIAFAVGAVTCLIAYLHWAYKVGEDQFASGGWREAGSGTAIGRIREWTYQPKGPDWLEIGFMGAGGVFTWILAKLSYHLSGFPLHPIGYALAVCFAMEYNWPAFLMVWILKGLFLRYGGLALYQRFIPAALGLTLGGIVVPVLWSFVSWVFGWYT